MLIPTHNTKPTKVAATFRFRVLTFTAYLLCHPVASPSWFTVRGDSRRNQWDKGNNLFFPLACATHEILAGNSEYNSYIPRSMECLFSIAQRYGQNCSCRLMKKRVTTVSDFPWA